MAVTSLAWSSAVCDAFQDIFHPLTQPAMALNIDLLLVLAMEQQQALITINRCSSEIAKLLTEQQQRNKAAQSVEFSNSPDEIEPVPSPWPARLVTQSTATKRPRLEIESSDEELTDALLLEAGMQHERITSAQPMQSPPPTELGSAAAQCTATLRLAQPASWSAPEHPKHLLDKPDGIE